MFLVKIKQRLYGESLTDKIMLYKEEKESAKKMTYQQWHEALEHPSPDYLKGNNYSDPTKLPRVPKDWQCGTCINSKSTKRKPTSTTDTGTRSDILFELIHSDLSGRFSKTSFGKSHYYVTFIDDCTRYTWIYPIHAKSDTVKVFTSFVTSTGTMVTDGFSFRISLVSGYEPCGVALLCRRYRL